MRITIETDDCNAPERAMSTFHDAEAAVAYMRYRMQFDPTACCILTREAAEEFLGEHYEEIDELPYQLMREIHPHDDSCEGEPGVQGSPSGDWAPSTRGKAARSGCGPQGGPDNMMPADRCPTPPAGAVGDPGRGRLCFTNVQYGDIDTIHDSVPCGAEIREFARNYECWQLWTR